MDRPSCQNDSTKRRVTRRFGQFVKLDSDFPVFADFTWHGNQNKIYLRTISPRPRLWINGSNAKPLPQYRHRTIHIQTLKLHLLNAFAEFRQKTRDGPLTRWLFAREHIQFHAIPKMQLEFLGILFWRHVRKRRLPISRPNPCERFAAHSYTHSDHRFRAKQQLR